MTPFELSLRVEAFVELEKDRQRFDSMLAYTNAKLPLLKKFPEYEEVFVKNQSSQSKEQSDDEMLKEIEKLNAMFGGTEVKE